MIEVEHVISNAIYNAIRQHAAESYSYLDDIWLTPAISRHFALEVLADLKRTGWTLAPPRAD